MAFDEFGGIIEDGKEVLSVDADIFSDSTILDEPNVMIPKQLTPPITKESRGAMGSWGTKDVQTDEFGGIIETDSFGKDTSNIKQLISQYQRPILQGLGAAGGTIIGGTGGLAGGPAAPITSPLGAVAGSAGGFAIADQLADIFDQMLGVREPQPMMLDLLDSAEDLAMGATFEMGGQATIPGVKFLGKGLKYIPGAVPLGQTLKSWGKDLMGIVPKSAEGVEKKAGDVLAALTHKGPLIVKNTEKARALEEAIPGLKFNLAQQTGDPGVIKFAKVANASAGDIAVAQAEQTASNTKAINDFIKKTKGAGTIEDVVKPLATKEKQIGAIAEGAKETLEQETSALSSQMTPINIDDTIKAELQASEDLMRKEASRMFEAVPQQELSAKKLYQDFKSILKPKHRAEGTDKFPAILRRELTEAKKAKTDVTNLKELQGLRSEILEDLRQAKEKNYPRSLRKRLSQSVAAIDDLLTKEGGGVSNPQAKLDSLIKQTPSSRLRDIYKNLRKVVHPDRVEKITKAATKGPDGKIYTGAIHVDAYMKIPNWKLLNMNKLDSGFVTDSGKYLTREEASILQGSSEMLDLIEIADGTLKLPGQSLAELLTKTSKSTQGSKELKQAQQFFKKNVIDKYAGTSEALLKGDADASSYFKSGIKGQQAAKEFNQALGDNATAKVALKQHINQDLLDKALVPKTGELTKASLNRWLKNNKYALDELGMTKEYDSIVKAQTKADSALIASKEFEKSSASQMLNADINEAITKAFAKGSKEKAAKQLMQHFEGIKSGLPDDPNILYHTTSSKLKGNKPDFDAYYGNKEWTETFAIDPKSKEVLDFGENTFAIRAPSNAKIKDLKDGTQDALEIMEEVASKNHVDAAYSKKILEGDEIAIQEFYEDWANADHLLDAAKKRGYEGLKFDNEHYLSKRLSKRAKAIPTKISKEVKPNKKAIAGLQNAMVDKVVSEVPLGVVDEVTPLLTSKNITNNLKQYDPALKVVFKDSPEKMKAMHMVRQAVEALEANPTVPKGTGIERAENLVAYLARHHGFSKSAIANIAAATISPLKNYSKDQVNGLINRALLDPELAYSLIYASKSKQATAIQPLMNSLKSLGLATQGGNNE